MWEIGKQVIHTNSGNVFQVLATSLRGRPVLERVNLPNGSFEVCEMNKHMYQPYTPPPPTTKHYVNTYINNNEYPSFGGIWPTREIARDTRDRGAVDLIELELSPNGKFIKARSVM